MGVRYLYIVILIPDQIRTGVSSIRKNHLARFGAVWRSIVPCQVKSFADEFGVGETKVQCQKLTENVWEIHFSDRF